jgi:hypothetical protein
MKETEELDDVLKKAYALLTGKDLYDKFYLSGVINALMFVLYDSEDPLEKFNRE